MTKNNQKSDEAAVEQHLPFTHAAHDFGVTPATLHAWRRRGHLIAVKMPNGRYMVPASEVRRILANRESA